MVGGGRDDGRGEGFMRRTESVGKKRSGVLISHSCHGIHFRSEIDAPVAVALRFRSCVPPSLHHDARRVRAFSGLFFT